MKIHRQDEEEEACRDMMRHLSGDDIRCEETCREERENRPIRSA